MQNKTLSATIDTMTEYAPAVLFIVMLLIFATTGYLQMVYYTKIFEGALEETDFVAVLIPIVIQSLRLVSGFLSASFFKKGRYVVGFFVLVCSLWLTGFEHREAEHMGAYWTTIDISLTTLTQVEGAKLELTQNAIVSVVHILVWSALVLELFLALWLGTGKSKKSDADDLLEDFSNNGTGQRKAAAVH